MNRDERPIAWLHGQIQTPPFSSAARLEAGFLLRKLQSGDNLALPHSRPMPTIGPRVHELRIPDRDNTWRIVYRTDEDAIVILAVFAKKTAATPRRTIEMCRQRLQAYDRAAGG